MGIDEIEWAGVRFLPLYRHDARFFRCPGLWAFARREFSGERTLLYVDHAENIASAVVGHRLLGAALGLGFNELHINFKVVERVDRLLLKGHVIRRCGPLLNLLEEEVPSGVGSVRRYRGGF
jgi:hypothetical protein